MAMLPFKTIPMEEDSELRRGPWTLEEEQLLILELHSKWGNRWSKIAQHLPGRTNNEIKNYWRTRVQKQARQLNVHDRSEGFVEAVRCFWMPMLLQKVEQTCSLKGMSSQSCMDPALSTIKIPNNSSENLSLVTCPTSFTNISEQTELTSPSAYGHTQIVEESCNIGYDMEGFSLEPISAVGLYEETNWISGETTDALWNIDEMMFRELEEIGINSNP